MLLILVTLADFYDVAVRVGNPDGAPSGNEGVETKRPQSHARILPHRSQRRVDVINNERDVAPAGVMRAILCRDWIRRLPFGLEQLEIRIPISQEDNLLSVSERNDPRPAEPEVLQVVALGHDRILTGNRDVVKG